MTMCSPEGAATVYYDPYDPVNIGTTVADLPEDSESKPLGHHSRLATRKDDTQYWELASSSASEVSFSDQQSKKRKQTYL